MRTWELWWAAKLAAIRAFPACSYKLGLSGEIHDQMTSKLADLALEAFSKRFFADGNQKAQS